MQESKKDIVKQQVQDLLDSGILVEPPNFGDRFNYKIDGFTFTKTLLKGVPTFFVYLDESPVEDLSQSDYKELFFWVESLGK